MTVGGFVVMIVEVQGTSRMMLAGIVGDALRAHGYVVTSEDYEKKTQDPFAPVSSAAEFPKREDVTIITQDPRASDSPAVALAPSTPPDSWVEPIEAWLQQDPTRAERGITTHDVLVGVMSLPDDACLEVRRKSSEMRVGRILRGLGWAKCGTRHVNPSGTRLWVFFPIASGCPEHQRPLVARPADEKA
jgi:hypothetical protein